MLALAESNTHKKHEKEYKTLPTLQKSGQGLKKWFKT